MYVAGLLVLFIIYVQPLDMNRAYTHTHTHTHTTCYSLFYQNNVCESLVVYGRTKSGQRTLFSAKTFPERCYGSDVWYPK